MPLDIHFSITLRGYHTAIIIVIIIIIPFKGFFLVLYLLPIFDYLIPNTLDQI